MPGKFAGRTGDGLPRNIGKNVTISLPLTRENGLAEIGIVRLQFDFAVAGFLKPTKPYFVQFELNKPLKVGSYDPALCCDMAFNIQASMQAEQQRIFEQDSTGRLELLINSLDGPAF